MLILLLLGNWKGEGLSPCLKLAALLLAPQAEREVRHCWRCSYFVTNPSLFLSSGE